MTIWRHLGLTVLAMTACLVRAFRADVRLLAFLALSIIEGAMLYSASRRRLTATIITTIAMATATGYILYVFAGWGTVALAILTGGGLALLLYPNEHHA